MHSDFNQLSSNGSSALPSADFSSPAPPHCELGGALFAEDPAPSFKISINFSVNNYKAKLRKRESNKVTLYLDSLRSESESEMSGQPIAYSKNSCVFPDEIQATKRIKTQCTTEIFTLENKFFAEEYRDESTFPLNP